MYSEQDLLSLYDFLRATPEGHLKKMMVNAKMTDVHLRVLLKIVRGCPQPEFVQHAQNAGLPKMKFNANEAAVKENFWPICLETCAQLGLIAKAAKAA